MKEIRAFLELTGLFLLPLLVFLFALQRETPAAAQPLADPVSAASFPTRSEPRRAVLAGDGAGVAAVPTAAEASSDEGVCVRLLTETGVVTMNLRDYLLGVVAAEMPASFQPEALMAQAVAARTDTLYRMQLSHPHAEADCCTDARCCKAFAAPETLRARWGADYEKWNARIEAAVSATDGEILTYGGKPIFAAFHAASAGATECSENVWLQALPYLRSVETAETAADVPAFRETLVFSADELAERLQAAVPAAVLPAEAPESWLTDDVRSESGRLLRVTAGGVTLSGSGLRQLLGLRSTAVTWRCCGDTFEFETEGYGHGVGLSQYGAEVMAASGSTHREILLHYYTGAEAAAWDDVFRG